MFIDLGLSFDPVTRRVDAALGADCDLVIDLTPITPMLISLGSDRRAEPDDPLPVGLAELNAGATIVERRGWPGDALDAKKRRIGSRLWLLERAKHTETVRRMAEIWIEECLDWAKPETGVPAEIEVEWARREVLAFRTMVDDTTITLTRGIGS